MKAKRLLLVICFLFITPNISEAQMYKCSGYNNQGDKVTVIVDFFTNVINFNGTVHRIAAGGAGSTYANTEGFPIENNLIVYDSFTIVNSHFFLIRYNNYTNSIVSSFSLDCIK